MLERNRCSTQERELLIEDLILEVTMNNDKQKTPTRPWWMINGAREPMGDVNHDWLDSERYRWAMVEVREDSEESNEK